ncbi:4-hydroxybenzoate octaprenyltransferase [Methyloligella sp. 2.7D]|uniref:4-hydroxybenzoate octaprenyltransferase n=1 Tax=unclassified Methyloligella TaxID=2625955 RepID=UPI00157D92A2|nr:4-hydroxybenzoate octaprenyltransferase [Methyloligella sp. GL2]QKP78337.1 4-hydroxybenzoate octaprenyltransferase [Methyloligella sp. GL2]
MTRPGSQGKSQPAAGQSAVADAVQGNWVDRYAPKALLPFLRLARADRPIGFWLLAIPCFWSVALGYRVEGVAFPDISILCLFGLGAFVMRGAGCTYNDIVDRDIDQGVARTRSRPIPSGQVSVKSAIAFMLLLCLIGLVVLLCFNGLTIFLGFLALPIVGLYPFVKRFSYWPQAVLGLAFGWGALMGYTAVQGELDWAPILLYLGAICWIIGYDTIYGHQDREDDALLGLKSTALRFGSNSRIWLAGFYGTAWVLFTLAGLAAQCEIVFLLGMVAAGAHLFWQVATLDIDDPDNCLMRFRSNRDFGAIVFAAIVADMYLAAVL